MSTSIENQSNGDMHKTSTNVHNGSENYSTVFNGDRESFSLFFTSNARNVANWQLLAVRFLQQHCERYRELIPAEELRAAISKEIGQTVYSRSLGRFLRSQDIPRVRRRKRYKRTYYYAGIRFKKSSPYAKPMMGTESKSIEVETIWDISLQNEDKIDPSVNITHNSSTVTDTLENSESQSGECGYAVLEPD